MAAIAATLHATVVEDFHRNIARTSAFDLTAIKNCPGLLVQEHNLRGGDMRSMQRLVGDPHRNVDAGDWLHRARLPVIATLANSSWGLIWLLVMAIMAIGGF